MKKIKLFLTLLYESIAAFRVIEFLFDEEEGRIISNAGLAILDERQLKMEEQANWRWPLS